MKIRAVLALLAALVLVGGVAAYAATPSSWLDRRMDAGIKPQQSSVPTGTTTATATAWPDATNTGVPTGTALTASGGLQLNTAGQVVDGLDIKGTVTINASNVVLKRSRVSASSYNVIKVADSATGVRIEDVEVNGNKGADGSNGIYGPATVLRADIQGVENGIQPGSGSVIQDSWIHDLGATGRPHIDGIQVDGARQDIIVRHNTIDLRGWTQTGAVMFNNYSGPASNMIVDRNRLLGGGYTVYSDGRFDGGAITGVQFTNNRIGYGRWGYASISVYDPLWTGNVDDQTGKAIPLR